MAHEVVFDAEVGRYSFAFTGDLPWWSADDVDNLENNRVKNILDADEWAEKSGAKRYQVLRAPLQYQHDGTTFQSDSNVVLFHSTSHEVFGVVSKQFQPVQPLEIFETMLEFCARAGLEMNVMGALKGGRKFFCLAKTPLESDILTNWPTRLYLLGSSENTGKAASVTGWTTVQVVCANTERLAMREMKNRNDNFSYHHRQEWDREAIANAIGLEQARTEWDTYVEQARYLVKQKMTDAEVQEHYETLLRAPKDEPVLLEMPKERELVAVAAYSNKDGSTRKVRGIEDLMESYHTAPGSDIPGVLGSAWGAHQGLTHYVDHVRGRRPEHRIDSALFGQGAALKVKSWERLLAA